MPGKTDAEARADIERKLGAHGIQAARVAVQTKHAVGAGCEKREIEVALPEGTKGVPDVFDCGVNLEGLDLKDRSKTDMELKTEIGQRLSHQGVSDAEVRVSTESDGRRRVEVCRRLAACGETC